MYGRQIVDLYHTLVRESLRQSGFDASSPAAFGAWQLKARRRLRRILGTLPRARVPLAVERRVMEETAGYVRERLVYSTRPGLQATAYLLTPRRLKGRAPAMLCLHGHSAGGKDESIAPGSIYRGFGQTFAEAGCVVLCPDQIGFGERALPEGRVNYQVLVHGLNMLGHTLIGLRYWDLVRALDLLGELPQVARGRIGVMGLSLGGEMTLFLAALERRVRAACICGYVTSHLGTFLHEPHCTCGLLCGLARHFEHVDLAALIAPRPLFLDAGRQDPSFPWQDAVRVVEELRPVYRLFGRPECHLGIEVHDGAHEISGAQSIPWMLARLREG
ncbi:MAG: alpha/beta hydrolase family protein [Candidatus Latescibacterota bacterium]